MAKRSKKAWIENASTVPWTYRYCWHVIQSVKTSRINDCGDYILATSHGNTLCGLSIGNSEMMVSSIRQHRAERRKMCAQCRMMLLRGEGLPVIADWGQPTKSETPR